MNAPLLISLPSGLIASGVVSWAVRLANSLCASRACGLLLHRPTPGHQPLDIPLDPRVRTFDAAHLPTLDTAEGDLGPFLDFYERAVRSMGQGPVIVSPNLLGDDYGVFAAISPRVDLRVAGWCHLDSAYDRRVLVHYAPVIAAYAGVSRAVTSALRAALPPDSPDVALLPYGVEIGPERGPRVPGAIRLIAVSRLEHAVKRAGALVEISRSLSKFGVDHTLTIIGDGPALEDVRRDAKGTPHVRVLGALPPASVREELLAHDALVLPSKAEGLSLAMLEAMSSGCAPVVTRGVSGAADAISPGVSGLLVDVAPDAGARPAGEAFARAIAACPIDQVRAMGDRARAVALERFSIEAHARSANAHLDAIAKSPRKTWREGRNPAFSARPGVVGSGSVPVDAAERVLRLLDRLKGQKVIFHATGRHTRELEHVLRPWLSHIVAFTDDDPARHGGTLWGRPVLAPEHAGTTGARHVVISSFIHQDEVYARRSVYERQGLSVHRLYA